MLDTNVLVSGLLSPFGAPGQLVRLVADGSLRLCHDARILSEYREVLARPRFGFNPAHVAALLDQIEAAGEVSATRPLAIRLPDPDDEPFLEAAVASAAECLVTGNGKHFPAAARRLARIVTPAELVRLIRSA